MKRLLVICSLIFPFEIMAANVGNIFPNVIAIDNKGKQHITDNYRGMVMLFYTLGYSWPPCRAKASSLETVFQKFKNEEFKMFGVDMFNGSITQVNAMVTQEGITYPILLKGVGLITGTENPKSRDELFVVDKEGVIVFYEYYGIYDSYDLDKVSVEAAVQTALNKSITTITKINQQNQQQHFSYQQVTDNKLSIQYFSHLKTVLSLDIFTNHGNKIASISSEKTNGLFNFKVNHLFISSGIYIVSVRNKDAIISSHKILIRK